MSARERLVLYPPIEPYRSERLGGGRGPRALLRGMRQPATASRCSIVHGGPGGGCNATMRRYHDPARYRIVLFDQRGCGRSLPHASLEANTTWDLVADIERLRSHLGIERWQLFGGSWGSTLALAYAETHPDARRAISSCAASSCCAARSCDWFYQAGCGWLFPEAFEEFKRIIPPRGARRHDRRLLPAPHPPRSRGADRGRPRLVDLGGQHALAGAGPRAPEAVRRRQLRHRLRPHRMPLLHQPRLLRARRPAARATCTASAICPAPSCTAATTW